MGKRQRKTTEGKSCDLKEKTWKWGKHYAARQEKEVVDHEGGESRGPTRKIESLTKIRKMHRTMNGVMADHYRRGCEWGTKKRQRIQGLTKEKTQLKLKIDGGEGKMRAPRNRRSRSMGASQNQRTDLGTRNWGKKLGRGVSTGRRG